MITAVSPPGAGQDSIRKAAPVTDRSPHLCRSTRPLSPATLDVPLLTPIDQWGYTPFPLQRLTPHSLSRRVRDLLAGDLGAHRDLPVDDEDPNPDPGAGSGGGAQGVQQGGLATGMGTATGRPRRPRGR